MPGLLAAREGALLAAAVQRLDPLPDVLLINATGRDHPRRAGLALHLGWALDLPTVGVTNRPLIARGAQPGPSAHSTSPLMIDDDQIGCWLRTRSGSRPVAVSPAWRMDLDTATAAVIAAAKQVRTVEPIRQARRLARTARAEADQAEATR
jgi:deoxyribonuclease V